MTDEKTKLIIEELKEAAKMYYQGLSPIMTDEEYDNKIDYLKEKFKDIDESELTDDIRELLYDSVSGGSSPVTNESNIIKYEVPMLSLGKANTLAEVKNYHEKIFANGANGVRLQCKLDGFAIEAEYINKTLKRVSTRGDGTYGEDISYLIDSPNLKILGLPKKMNNIENCKLRGELFSRHSQFEVINKNRELVGHKAYSNPRNGTVGLIKRAEDGLDFSAEITFCVYSILVDNKYVDLNAAEYSIYEDIITINELTKREWVNTGHKNELMVKSDFQSLDLLLTEFGEARGEFDCPTDGVVIKPTNETELYEKMGVTSHHPLAFMAFKYPATKKVAEVLSIDVSIGKTGKLTPRAIITPTELDGSIVTKASCHNFNWMYEKGVNIGSKVVVTKANDIIPAIMTVISQGDGGMVEIPTICSECGSSLISDGLDVPKTLVCPNDYCTSRLYFSMRDAVGKQGFDIDGLNNVSLQAICDTGKITDVSSFFSLKVEDFSELVVGVSPTGKEKLFGDKRAKKIIDYLEKSKKTTQAYKVLNALEIPNVGPNTSKKLLDNFGSIENVLNATKDDLLDLDGFGEIIAESIIKYRNKAISIYNKLESYNVKMDNGLNKVSVEVKGSFSLSGKVPPEFSNREEFVNYMETKGYLFDKSPKKTTTYMFGNEDDTSSKIVKAKKIGIKILPIDEYKNI